MSRHHANPGADPSMINPEAAAPPPLFAAPPPGENMAETVAPRPAPPRFDGPELQPDDHARLGTQLERVRRMLLTGQLFTLAQLAEGSGASEAGVSARIRDLRKRRHGGHKVEKRRVAGGLWHYWIPASALGLVLVLGGCSEPPLDEGRRSSEAAAWSAQDNQA